MEAVRNKAAKKDANKETETAGDLMSTDPAFHGIAADIEKSNNDEGVQDPTTTPIEQDPLPKDPARADITGDKSATLPDLTEESLAQIPVVFAERSDEQKVSILIGLDLLQVISFHGFICCFFLI